MRLSQQAIDKLAAQYALGTLRHGARRRFETLLQTDAELRRAVTAWQDRLHPIGLVGQPVEPPARVWEAIAQRTAMVAAPAQAPRASPPRSSDDTAPGFSLRFWRWLGMGSSALAAVLLAVLLLGRPAPPALPAYVAVLADQKAQAFLVAAADRDGRVRVQLLQKPTLAADKSYELWALPANGKPQSLGLLNESSRELKLEPGRLPAQAPGLAVSLEPAGGSRNPDGPSGPVLYSGKWLPA